MGSRSPLRLPITTIFMLLISGSLIRSICFSHLRPLLCFLVVWPWLKHHFYMWRMDVVLTIGFDASFNSNNKHTDICMHLCWCASLHVFSWKLNQHHLISRRIVDCLASFSAWPTKIECERLIFRETGELVNLKSCRQVLRIAISSGSSHFS